MSKTKKGTISPSLPQKKRVPVNTYSHIAHMQEKKLQFIRKLWLSFIVLTCRANNKRGIWASRGRQCLKAKNHKHCRPRWRKLKCFSCQQVNNNILMQDNRIILICSRRRRRRSIKRRRRTSPSVCALELETWHQKFPDETPLFQQQQQQISGSEASCIDHSIHSATLIKYHLLIVNPNLDRIRPINLANQTQAPAWDAHKDDDAHADDDGIYPSDHS